MAGWMTGGPVPAARERGRQESTPQSPGPSLSRGSPEPGVPLREVRTGGAGPDVEQTRRPAPLEGVRAFSHDVVRADARRLGGPSPEAQIT
jgi:hypothetical protein